MTDLDHNRRKARIAVVHPRLGHGGSEARALQLIAALKDEYDVSLVTGGAVRLGRLNAYYGTSLLPSEFAVLRAPMPSALAVSRRLDALRGAFVQRYCRRVARHFDLMISAYNCMDFGVPGIQFLADFSFDERLRRRFHSTQADPDRWLHRDSPLRAVYRRAFRALAGGNGSGIRRNLTVANSSWSARLWRERYGTECMVVYPPVLNSGLYVPWEQREDGFVYIGRISAEKRIEEAIDILRQVRSAGYDVHLHVAGPLTESGYCHTIRHLAADYREWVRLEGIVAGNAKGRLLSGHRYGINACRGEAFGISVAEMTKAGCIVFAPEEGGQAEILASSHLLFADQVEAAAKIGRVLQNDSQQRRLRSHLRDKAGEFSAARFRSEARALVRELLERKAKVTAR